MSYVRGARVAGDEGGALVVDDSIREGGLLHKDLRKMHAGDPDLHGRLRIAGEEYVARRWWQPGHDGVRYLKLNLSPA